ncbi:MAG: GNAT family N-acetyltransferase [Pirellula sp.]
MRPTLAIVESVDLGDLVRIQELRYRILRKPFGMPYASAQFPEDNLSATLHLMATSNQGILGCASLLFDLSKSRTQLRGMAIAEEWQRHGIGTLLLERVHEIGVDRKQQLWCNARASAVAFYQRNGWTTCGDFFDVPLVGAHIVMEWHGMSSGKS